MISFYPGKVNYIVDRRSVDIVIDAGFKMTKLVRCIPSGYPEVNNKDLYRDVKKALSDVLHKRRVFVRSIGVEVLHEVWAVDFYEMPEDGEDYDVTSQGLSNLRYLNPLIIEKVKRILNGGPA